MLRARVRDGTGLATAPPESRGHLDEEPGGAGRQSAGSPPAPGAPAWLVTLTSSAGGPRVSRPTRQSARQTALCCRFPLAGGGQPPPPKPPRSNSPGHAPLPRRLRLSEPGREAGAEPGRQLSESEFQRNVSVPSGVHLGVLAVRAGGFLVALSRDWQPRLKPPSLPFRHRAPHAGPTEDFELTQLGPSGQGRGWGGRRWHYCCLPPPLVGLPAAGWHSPVSAIERLIIIILKFFSILCFIF